MSKNKLEDVFVANGQPSVTYTSREKYETDVKNSLKRNGKLIYLAGPSKNGKSVLAIHVAKDRERIFVPCGSIGSKEDFFDFIYQEIMIPSETTVTNGTSNTSTTMVKATLSFKLRQVIASFSGGLMGGFQDAENVNNSTVHKYSNSSKSAILSKVISTSDLILILDDFHYLNDGLQQEILQILKGWITNKNSIIVTTVKHRESDIIRMVPEMKGRVNVIKIAEWEKEDLEKIVSNGEVGLNFEFSLDLKQKILNESYKNPMLVQEISYKICEKMDILEKLDTKKEVDLDEKDFSEVLSEIASSMGDEEVISYFEKGKDSKGTKRNQYKFSDGYKRDIYQAILYYLKEYVSMKAISTEEITTKLHALMVDETIKLPNLKSSVKSTLTHINDIDDKYAERSNVKTKVIDFDEEKKSLYILDPFFAFYLKWGYIENLEKY